MHRRFYVRFMGIRTPGFLIASHDVLLICAFNMRVLEKATLHS